MDRFTQQKLNLQPRSHEDLHDALAAFEVKWRDKARRQLAERHG